MTDSNYKSEHNLDTMSKNLPLIFIVRNGFACFLVSPFQGLSSQTALEQSKEKIWLSTLFCCRTTLEEF